MGGRGWKFTDKMWCKYCRDTQDNIAIFIKSRSMIEGTNAFKLETITYHEGSKCHRQAETIIKNTKETPAKAPAAPIRSQLDPPPPQKKVKRLEILFLNVHSVIKTGKSFTDFKNTLQRSDPFIALGIYLALRPASKTQRFTLDATFLRGCVRLDATSSLPLRLYLIISFIYFDFILFESLVFFCIYIFVLFSFLSSKIQRN